MTEQEPVITSEATAAELLHKRRCTYDNRTTMAREFWEDGKLVFCVSCELIWDVKNHNHPTVKRLHDFLPILQRGWRGGKIQGDSKALQQSTEPAPKE